MQRTGSDHTRVEVVSKSLSVTLLVALSLVLVGLVVQQASRSSEPRVPLEPTNGDEIVMVLFASSTCGWCQQETLPPAIDTIRSRLQRLARNADKTFVSVAIAPEFSHEAAFEFLQRFGAFDETLIGRGWLNSGALDYVWDTHVGRPATPQVIVLERLLSITRPPQPWAINVSRETILARLTGLSEILSWVEAGNPSTLTSPAAP